MLVAYCIFNQVRSFNNKSSDNVAMKEIDFVGVLQGSLQSHEA